MTKNLYADRDSESLGEHYLRHIDRMTVEKLHSKSAIAGELAHRDAEIAALRKAVEAWGHASNEWADSATSGLQWLRNIRDGISTVEAAINNTEGSIKHCMEVTAIAQAVQPTKEKP